MSHAESDRAEKSTWDTAASIQPLASLEDQELDTGKLLVPFPGTIIRDLTKDFEPTKELCSDSKQYTSTNQYSPYSVTASAEMDDPQRTMDAGRPRSIEERVKKASIHSHAKITVEILQSVGEDETYYKVNLSTINRTFWCVSYRFTYFRVLREFIETNVEQSLTADFPGVYPLSWIMNMQQTQLEARHQQLWEWITELISKYSTFSRVVRAGISAFFNGSSPEYRIEKYLLAADQSCDDVCDRCYINTAIMHLKDHPTYIVSVNSIWRQNWDVQYRFKSFRMLHNFIMERLPKMICFEFPRTHQRSSYGMKLPKKDLVERHVHLKFWMCDALACFPFFSEEIQEEFCLFVEGHPKYQPIAILSKDGAGKQVSVSHENVAGKFSWCTNPISGVDMLLGDYGLSDEILEATEGRLASSKLLNILAFLQLPDNVAFEITRYSAVDSKIIFSDQLLKWGEIKSRKTFKNPRQTLSADQEKEMSEIEASVEPFYEYIYKISILPDDDIPPTTHDPQRPKMASLGNLLHARAREQEYSGIQLIAGKISSAFQALNIVEDTIYCSSYACLEKILDSGVEFSSYSIIGGKKNSAASVRTATCVSLLGEVSLISPHLPFIDNAQSVFKKILEDEECGERIPGSLKYVAAVMKQLMDSENIRVGTETSSKQLERTKSQIEEAESEYRKVLNRNTPTDEDGIVRVGDKALRREALDALFEVLAAPNDKPASRRATMVGLVAETGPATLPRKMATRRLSTDDSMLLRLAHYGANAHKLAIGGLNRMRSESIEQDLAETVSQLSPRTEQPHSPVSNMAELPILDVWNSPRRRNPSTKRASLKDQYRFELQNAFDLLVQDTVADVETGEKRLTLQKLLDWDQVQAVLLIGDLTVDDVTNEFNKVATYGLFASDNDCTIDFDSFCSLMETLENVN